jgi:hypothetical protein
MARGRAGEGFRRDIDFEPAAVALAPHATTVRQGPPQAVDMPAAIVSA